MSGGTSTTRDTFSITISNQNDTCTYAQIFECVCNVCAICCVNIGGQTPVPVEGPGHVAMTIHYEDGNVPRVPLTFWLNDFAGNKLAIVYQLLPNLPPVGSFSLSMAGRMPGTYFITAESSSGVVYGVLQFVKM